MIRTADLTKIFQTDEVETAALYKVNIRVLPGEFVAVMGPSGCGKSTLLNILGMIDGLTHGKYFLNGMDVSGFKENQRIEFRKGKIGFVFQNFNLIDELTVSENVELPLVYMKIRAMERRHIVDRLLERMKIKHRKDHFPQQLSGGQQQRVAISRALVTSPRLLLADEPTGNLDSKNGLEVMKILTELNKEGTTIVMVTHSERDSGFAHRIINLFDGKILDVEEDHDMIAKYNDEDFFRSEL